jgi:hypothetical protein
LNNPRIRFLVNIWSTNWKKYPPISLYIPGYPKKGKGI